MLRNLAVKKPRISKKLSRLRFIHCYFTYSSHINALSSAGMNHVDIEIFHDLDEDLNGGLMACDLRYEYARMQFCVARKEFGVCG